MTRVLTYGRHRDRDAAKCMAVNMMRYNGARVHRTLFRGWRAASHDKIPGAQIKDGLDKLCYIPAAVILPALLHGLKTGKGSICISYPHDCMIIERADRIITLQDGHVVNDRRC